MNFREPLISPSRVARKAKRDSLSSKAPREASESFMASFCLPLPQATRPEGSQRGRVNNSKNTNKKYLVKLGEKTDTRKRHQTCFQAVLLGSNRFESNDGGFFSLICGRNFDKLAMAVLHTVFPDFVETWIAFKKYKSSASRSQNPVLCNHP